MSATLFTMAFGDKRLPYGFWRRVEVQPNGCWRWTGAMKDSDPESYGVYEHNGQVRAHRVMAAAIFGTEAIDGFEICHNCGPGGDNKWCCQPEHLFIGTAKENARDAIIKGQCSRVGRRGPVSSLEGRDDEILHVLRTLPRSRAAIELGISETQLRRWCKARSICQCCAQPLPAREVPT